MSSGRVSVLFDGEAFYRHRRSGITRYFAELVGQFVDDPSNGVDAQTPYRWVSSAHLAERLPSRFHQLPMPYRMRDRTLSRINRSRRLRGNADIAHHSLYDLDAFDRWPGRRHVASVYDFTIELYPESLPAGFGELDKKNAVLERADGLLCISQTTRDDLIRLHPHLDVPIAVTPLGASDHFREPKGRRVRGLPDRYLLHVGNRFAHKNVDLLLRAFAELAERDRTLGLVLCGLGGPDERDRLAELGIAERVRVIRVSDAQLPALYRDAEAFVFPSLYEGFGLPVVEAMAAGTPVVMADTPTLREVGGDAALTFEPIDVSGLAAQIERVLADETVRELLRAAGRRQSAGYSWQATAAATARAYREILAAG